MWKSGKFCIYDIPDWSLQVLFQVLEEGSWFHYVSAIAAEL